MNTTGRGAGDEIPRELKLELPAVHSGARLARHVLRAFAKSNGVNGRDLDGMLLVAEELLTNAVDHGGGHAAHSVDDLAEPVSMTLQCVITKGAWEMRVADQGGGDPAVLEELLRPGAMPDLDDERGRGFFLLNSMVEQLSVQKSDDGKGLMVIAVARHGARS